MNWDEIESFIRVQAPRGFMDGCKGVAIEQVRACERSLDVELPQMYVDFLVCMGVSSGWYRPFGAPFDQDFHRLVAQPRFARYSTRRWFRIGIEIDPDIEIQEPYLDLARARDGDTPLVSIEGGSDAEDFFDLGPTLAETLTRSAFVDFGMGRPQGATVMAWCETEAEIGLLRDEAVALLCRLGLVPPLVPTPHLVCMRSAELSALIELHGEQWSGLCITLGGKTRAPVQRATEILVDALPGASRYSRSR